MNSVSLYDIEKSMYMLWTKKDTREAFNSGSLPEGVHPDLADSIDVKGVGIYSSLIRTGQNDLMNSIYPGCAGLIGKGFSEVVRQYFEHYPACHHNFNQAASRFSLYLKEFADKYLKKYPFLPELADYEWIELEIMEHPNQGEDCQSVELVSPELFDNYYPVINEALVIRHYDYPITKIVDWLKDDVRLPRRVKRDPVSLAIYRSREDNSARFLELGKTACLVVESAIDRPTSYAELIKLAVQSQPGADPQRVVLEFLELIEKLRELELFVGCKPIK